MSKKSLFIFIIISTLFVGCTAPSKEIDSRVQERANAAHNLIINSMGVDEIGNVNFPNNYAGSWIEEEKLVIALTDTSDASAVEYENWAGEYADVLQFKKAKYSYNYLYAKMDEIVNDVSNNHGIEILNYGVSEMENEIFIVVDSKDYVNTLGIKYDIPVSFQCD